MTGMQAKGSVAALFFALADLVMLKTDIKLSYKAASLKS